MMIYRRKYLNDFTNFGMLLAMGYPELKLRIIRYDFFVWTQTTLIMGGYHKVAKDERVFHVSHVIIRISQHFSIISID